MQENIKHKHVHTEVHVTDLVISFLMIELETLYS